MGPTMFRKLAGLIGLGFAAAGLTVSAEPAQPYANKPAARAIYELLFCDDPSAFAPKPGNTPTDWQVLLYGPAQDPVRITLLAKDSATQSRTRALAFNWLRAHGEAAPKGVILGVIIEVPLDQGLDVLAAYADGSVRYINHAGRIAVIEPNGLPEANAQAKRLVDMAQSVAAVIGLSEEARQSPPAKPDARVTFVASDGLHYRQGPFETMQSSALAGPLIRQGSQLLMLVVNAVVPEPAPSGE